MITSVDREYIKMTFALAKKGLGTVSPNPLVGSVIVKDNIIIGEGHHEIYGGPHAEPNAINNARESVEGATLYCNLEPCCHTNKQTPPCTNLIINSKIKRVVIANLDPNPMVAGKGVKVLQDAGILVEYGVLEEEGKKLNEVFFKFIQSKKPFIHIKLAQTLDGKIATQTGDSKWISDSDARTKVHELRLKYDAVLIGRKTLNQDNAKLNIRMGIEAKGKVPYRVVVGSLQNIDLSSTIFNDEHTDKTIVITSIDDYRETADSIIDFVTSKKIKFIFASIEKKKLNLEEAFNKLGEMNITSVLVEGGSKVITTLLNENLYDKISFFICPKVIGNGDSFYVNDSLTNMKQALEFNNVYMEQINNQIIVNAYKNVEANPCLQA